MELNKQQKEAIQTIDGPLLVLAGAGSGKTRVITQRIIHLLENGVPTTAILALTFTNKAASEMKHRVEQKIEKRVSIGTFHKIGVHILRESIETLGFQRNFTIYDEEDSLKLLNECMGELSIQSDKKKLKQIRQGISRKKNEVQSAGYKNNSETSKELKCIYPLYVEKLKRYNALDFDDLLCLTVRLFKEHPQVLADYQERWRYLLVDEYQDTNTMQYEIVNLLAKNHKNVCVVGDPDQSIYSWRGANIHNILNFQSDYPNAKVIHLEQNYRSRTNILDASNNVINKHTRIYDKHLWSERGPGEKIKLYCASDETDEACFVMKRILHYYEHGTPLKDIAVLYRINAQSRVFEDALRQEKIPYVLVGGVSFYQRREIKDILAYLRIAFSKDDLIAFSRTVNLPKRGLGKATIDRLVTCAQSESMTLIDYCTSLIHGVPLNSIPKMSKKNQEGLKNYIQVINEIYSSAKNGSLSDVVQTVLESSGYENFLTTDPVTYEDRLENLNQLMTKAVEWEKQTHNPTIPKFLEELSLYSTLDEVDYAKNCVHLMTVHNSKGLEFDIVFLAGVEVDLFPHSTSVREERTDEERRLFYVGMTRTKEVLHISYCQSRFMWGMRKEQFESPFIIDIPHQCMEEISQEKRHLPDFQEFTEENQQWDEYSIGEAIVHTDFGIGTIQNVTETSAGLIYQILFHHLQEEKSIAARFACLKRLD